MRIGIARLLTALAIACSVAAISSQMSDDGIGLSSDVSTYRIVNNKADHPSVHTRAQVIVDHSR